MAVLSDANFFEGTNRTPATELWRLLKSGRPDWHADAACREHPEVSWFPDVGETGELARAIWSGCLVRSECLDYALTWPGAAQGIWAGTSEDERRALRRRRSLSESVVGVADYQPAITPQA